MSWFVQLVDCRKKISVKKKEPAWEPGDLLVTDHFCCNRAALNFDTLLEGSWGGATSSCFLSGIVGRVGAEMVR